MIVFYNTSVTEKIIHKVDWRLPFGLIRTIERIDMGVFENLSRVRGKRAASWLIKVQLHILHLGERTCTVCLNTPFSSSLHPPFESESKCKCLLCKSVFIYIERELITITKLSPSGYVYTDPDKFLHGRILYLDRLFTWNSANSLTALTV